MATREQRKRVRAAFDGVLKTYFSQWDAGSSWAIRIETQSRYTDERGRCIPDRRVITVNPGVLARPSDELEELLVHECCHAVTTPAHGVRWTKRMRSAASRAHAVGREAVAERILKELDLHEEAAERGEGGVSEVEALVSSVLMECPEVTFDQTVRFLCGELVLPRKVLQEKVPRLRALYRRKKEENDERRAEERAWRKATGQDPEG